MVKNEEVFELEFFNSFKLSNFSITSNSVLFIFSSFFSILLSIEDI